MVSEHMLTVGHDPRNWQAHRKDFLYKLSFQKHLLPLFSSELIQIFPFSETIPLSPFDPEDSTDETTPRSTRYRTIKTTWNKKDFYRSLQWRKIQRWRLRRLRIWRLWRISRLVWPRKATLMELGRLWKLSIPEIKVCWRKTGTRRVKNSEFLSRKP